MLSARSFDPSAIDPDTAAYTAELERQYPNIPRPDVLGARKTREARESGQSLTGPIVKLDVATDRSIPGPAGQIPLRVFVPPVVNGVHLHIHGGGFVLGRNYHQDARLWDLAQSASVAVVSVDYRLAPEHPYPAGPDDCEAAGAWLAKNAKAEFGTDRLTIGGDSAGGHLSAVTLLRLRDRHGFTGFRGADLTYGAFDLSLTPSQRNWGERYLVLSTPIIRWFMEQFLPPGVDRRDPDVSPLYARLQDMPPALFTVGTTDPLLDDSLFMYSRWLAAGNRAELAVYPGAVHGFIGLPYALARKARERVCRFIARAVAPRARRRGR